MEGLRKFHIILVRHLKFVPLLNNKEQHRKKVTKKKGVAAVFDGVGKSTFDLSLDCLARKGTMASFGNASGAVPPFAIA